MTTTAWSPQATLLLATSLWGCSSAALARVGSDLGSSAPFVAAGGALCLWLVAWVADSRGRGTVTAPPTLSRFALLGFLEAMNLGLFAASLRLATPPIAVALHLTTPIFLAAAMVNTRRRPTPATLMMLGLITVATAVSLRGVEGAGRPHQATGALLALSSAAVLAVLVTLTTRTSTQTNASTCAAAGQLTGAAVFLAPLAATGQGLRPVDYATAVALGVVFLGPGLALYWSAVRHLSPTRTSIIGLNEAVVTTAISAAFFGREVNALSVISTALLAVAVIQATRERLAPADTAAAIASPKTCLPDTRPGQGLDRQAATPAVHGHDASQTASP